MSSDKQQTTNYSSKGAHTFFLRSLVGRLLDLDISNWLNAILSEKSPGPTGGEVRLAAWDISICFHVSIIDSIKE